MTCKRITAVIGITAIALLWCSAATAQPRPLYQDRGDRPGSDYRVFDISSPQSCAIACEADGRCRAWTFVRPGVQGPSARCYLKNSHPALRQDACCVSGLINPVHEIRACGRIGNIQGAGAVTCIDPGGRNYAHGARGFQDGDEIFILVRFRRLPVGNYRLRAIYQRQSHGQYVNFSRNLRELSFKNGSENWAFWFPAHFKETGRWRVNVELNAPGITDYSLGVANYVHCGARCDIE